ncbi:MAG: hypothetical protein IT581_13675 [Verrucomicrobiales bacterium]|nr:hypothetical protein [Verrucomicrobiales bacterium]
MRSNLGKILSRRGVNLAARGTSIILRWKEFDGQKDPVTGAKPDLAFSNSEIVHGFVHAVAPGAHAVRLFNEVETGDIMVDINPTVSLNRPGLVFEIGGVKYVQKPLGDKLAAANDATVRGQATFQTLLLRRQT